MAFILRSSEAMLLFTKRQHKLYQFRWQAVCKGFGIVHFLNMCRRLDIQFPSFHILTSFILMFISKKPVVGGIHFFFKNIGYCESRQPDRHGINEAFFISTFSWMGVTVFVPCFIQNAWPIWIRHHSGVIDWLDRVCALSLALFLNLVLSISTIDLLNWCDLYSTLHGR